MSSSKILVAEDDKFLSRAYDFKLAKIGFKVILAHDGEETLVKAKTEKPDLILLDLIMPKKSGFDVLNEIKSLPEVKDIPVIIMSNLGQEVDVKKGMDAGAIDYVIKASTSLEDVVLIIEKALGKTGKKILTELKKDSPNNSAPTCSKCHKPLPKNTKFCPECGEKIME